MFGMALRFQFFRRSQSHINHNQASNLNFCPFEDVLFLNTGAAETTGTTHTLLQFLDNANLGGVDLKQSVQHRING